LDDPSLKHRTKTKIKIKNRFAFVRRRSKAMPSIPTFVPDPNVRGRFLMNRKTERTNRTIRSEKPPNRPVKFVSFRFVSVLFCVAESRIASGTSVMRPLERMAKISRNATKMFGRPTKKRRSRRRRRPSTKASPNSI
jgi:hypothetical protein